MRWLAHAKINWTLDITGLRADGYHLMDMLMQPIALADVITIEPAEKLTLCVSGTPAVPADQRNLALRAALALRRASGDTSGAAISLEKHIPSGAGLGGGSADAAAVLYGLNLLWDLRWPLERLCEIGLELGADIPFCLTGALSRVRGIGERVLPLGDGLRLPCVIVQPCEALSTGEVFRLFDSAQDITRPQTDAVQAALTSGRLRDVPRRPGNVLEAVSIPLRPQIAEAIDALLAAGASVAQMSGSGSAVFGIFAGEQPAEKAAATLRARWPVCHLTHTQTASVTLLP